MNLSAVGAQTRLGRALRWPLRALPPAAVLPVLQGPARGMRWVVGSGVHGCWVGCYEQDKVRLFAASLRPGDVVYDVGANAGYYSLVAARRVGATGQVVAFEPYSLNVAALSHHVALNRLGNVEVVAAAVAARSGRGTFTPGANLSEGRLVPLDVPGLAVQTVSLDDWVGCAPRWGRANRPPPR